MILNLQNQEELSSPWAPPAAFPPSPVGAPGWMETALSYFFFTCLIFGEVLVHPLAKANTQASMAPHGMELICVIVPVQGMRQD